MQSGSGRVSERSQKIEDRANADFTTCCTYMIHRWMVTARIQKSDAYRVYALCALLRRNVQAYSQSFQHISAAAHSTGSAIAVFGHRQSRGSGNKCGSG